MSFRKYFFIVEKLRKQISRLWEISAMASYNDGNEMFKIIHRTPGKHGYSIKFSPFVDNRLVYATCENYGIQGRGALYYLEIFRDGSIVTTAAFDWPDGLFDVAWSEGDPDVCVAASGDGSLQLWSMLKPGSPIQILKEHTKEAYSVEWSQQKEEKFASASWDGTVKIWSPMTPSSLCTFFGHHNVVYNGDHTLRIWNSKSSNTAVLTIPAHNAEILHCDWNKYNENVIVTGAVDGLVRAWDLRNPQKCVYELREHQYAVRRVKFSPHHESVLATVSYDFNTRIWDLGRSPHAIEVLHNHTEFVYGLDFNLHIEGQLADCAFDELLCIYNSKALQQPESNFC